jgi:hypothetical protein
VAIDKADTYTLTATIPTEPNNPGVPGNAVSNKFTISPEMSTDYLVFLNLPNTVPAGASFSVTVTVEDQFGNVDKAISTCPPIWLLVVATSI